MTTQRNPDEIARLIAEARRHADALAPALGWRNKTDSIAWLRENARAMADQLKAAQAEIARLSGNLQRAVVIAVDAALGEVARQQGGIASPTGVEARGAGLRAALAGRAYERDDLTAERDKLQAELEAAQAEIVKMRFESFTEATTTLALSNSNQAKDEYIDAITAERDKLQAELEASAAKIARLEQQHDGMCKIVEATTGTIDKLNATRAELESARKDAEHWREARRVALEGGEILKTELEAARREVERLRSSEGRFEALIRRLEHLATDARNTPDAYRAARDKAGG